MRDDGGHLSAGECDVLTRQVVDGPGAGVQGVVEGVLPAEAPVPALQGRGVLHAQHLLVDRLTPPTQAHRKLGRDERMRDGRDEWDSGDEPKGEMGGKKGERNLEEIEKEEWEMETEMKQEEMVRETERRGGESRGKNVMMFKRRNFINQTHKKRKGQTFRH